MARLLKSYVRTERLTVGLSQKELGYLVGVSEDVIGNCERGVSRPTLKVLVGCLLVFGGTPAHLFPALFAEIQDSVGRRAAQCDQRWRGQPGNERKLELLSAIAARTISASEV
jgi:transcriptional regulator with XRE-family HTH domain